MKTKALTLWLLVGRKVLTNSAFWKLLGLLLVIFGFAQGEVLATLLGEVVGSLLG